MKITILGLVFASTAGARPISKRTATNARTVWTRQSFLNVRFINESRLMIDGLSRPVGFSKPAKTWIDLSLTCQIAAINDFEQRFFKKNKPQHRSLATQWNEDAGKLPASAGAIGANANPHQSAPLALVPLSNPIAQEGSTKRAEKSARLSCSRQCPRA
jgi:hypothetical protein